MNLEKSNIDRDFLNLVTEFLPKGNPLWKIFNRNTIKIRYRYNQDIESIISSKNKKLLAASQPDERLCSCTKNNPCPLEGQCLRKNIIYQATVTLEDKSEETYTGLCSTAFKKRLGVHKNSFKYEDKNQTSLSKFIWDLKRKNKKFESHLENFRQGGTIFPHHQQMCIVWQRKILHSIQTKICQHKL